MSAVRVVAVVLVVVVAVAVVLVESAEEGGDVEGGGVVVSSATTVVVVSVVGDAVVVLVVGIGRLVVLTGSRSGRSISSCRRCCSSSVRGVSDTVVVVIAGSHLVSTFGSGQSLAPARSINIAPMPRPAPKLAAANTATIGAFTAPPAGSYGPVLKEPLEPLLAWYQ